MNKIVEELQDNKIVKTRLGGNSMTPIIKSKQLVTIEPCKPGDLSVGDVVYCRVKGSYYLHLIKQISTDGRFLIGNNHGRINGWTRNVFGKLTNVEP